MVKEQHLHSRLTVQEFSVERYSVPDMNCTLAKSEEVCITGWFTAPFPDMEEGQEGKGGDLPRDGFMQIESIV